MQLQKTFRSGNPETNDEQAVLEIKRPNITSLLSKLDNDLKKEQEKKREKRRSCPC